MKANSGEVVDHINHNLLDNRRQNLRICTPSENKRNRVLAKNNSSGYKGVNWSKGANKWRTQISINGKQKHLGLFNNILLAAEAYDSAAQKYYGEFAYTNFKNGDILAK